MSKRTGESPLCALRKEGLCGACIHRKEIRNDRGSVFIQCLRSFREPEYPKYPRLPVLECRGFEPRPPK